MDEKCGICRFSLEVGPKQSYVKCRRFPPTISRSEEEMLSERVPHFGILVKPDWWCGEFSPKKGK